MYRFIPSLPAITFSLVALLVLAFVPIPIIVGVCLVLGFNPFTATI